MTSWDRQLVSFGSRAVQITETAPSLSFIGGMRLPCRIFGFNMPVGYNVTWPLARLDLLEDGVRIYSNVGRPLSIIVPTWEAGYSELTEVSAVGIGRFASGVRFRTATDGSWIIFWSLQREQLLEALRPIGLPLITQPQPFDHFRPG